MWSVGKLYKVVKGLYIIFFLCLLEVGVTFKILILLYIILLIFQMLRCIMGQIIICNLVKPLFSVKTDYHSKCTKDKY